MHRSAPLTAQALQAALGQLPGWTVEGGTLVKVDRGESFAAVIAWVVAVARVADEMDHHPDIEIRYREVTWRLSTHAVDALTELDIALAHAIDHAVAR